MSFCKMLAALSAAAIVAVPAQAWDAAGHMLVDEIAWTQMKPAARDRASELLRGLDSRFNEHHPYHFVTAGCWMDDMRGMGREYPWGKLHYVDIPWTPSGVEIRIPPGPNILSGIEDSLNRLRNPAAPPNRAEALAMLIHFVADLHQPLHVTERDHDRGGNSYLIGGIPFSDLMPRQVSNLHTFWDKAFRFDGVDGRIIEAWRPPSVSERPRAPDEGIIAERAGRIMAVFPRDKLPELTSAGDASTWARQAHLVGCLYAYPAGEPPSDTELRLLDPRFVRKAHLVANRQIALAGYRLGDLLNSLLAP